MNWRKQMRRRATRWIVVGCAFITINLSELILWDITTPFQVVLDGIGIGCGLALILLAVIQRRDLA